MDNSNMENNLLKTVMDCVKIPEIYLPASGTDLENWAVIACDQYTSDLEYWEKVRKRTKNSDSTYHLVLPEIYLEEPAGVPVKERVKKINSAMDEYLNEGKIVSEGKCMVFLNRKTPLCPSRKGLLIAIDLEKYDYRPDSDNLIRATEGTVTDRIPPRLDIRRDASLEIPHVQLLMDDPSDSVIGPLAKKAGENAYEKLYDTKLPEGGGHIRGYKIPEESDDINKIYSALSKLSSLSENGLLFAVGDGNHSLATAKTHWDNIKSEKGNNHPARYALVELINIYDEGIVFEPIHRVLFNAPLDKFIREAKKICGSGSISVSEKMSVENAILMARTIDRDVLPVPVFSGDEAVVFTFPDSGGALAVKVIQDIIDEYISLNPKARVDYIHGDDQVRKLAGKNTGLLLPGVSKDVFFSDIAREGVYPRKTFSIGEAYEKRYYIECKKIK